MFRNLVFFLIPLLVPILILGSLSILITQHYVKEDINQKNMRLLMQTRDNLELILNEIDTLTLTFQTSNSIAVRLKEILNTQTFTYDQTTALDLLSNFASAPAYARPYIDSIYVYYNNPFNKSLTSTEGLVTLDKFYDRGWYDSYLKGNTADSWLEQRSINRYGIQNKRVVSVYRKLYTAGSSKASGIIVLNILPEYIENMLGELVSKEQSVIIANNSLQVLFQTKMPDGSSEQFDLQKIISSSDQVSSVRMGNQTFTLTHLQSGIQKLHYISLIPQGVLYQIPIQLSQITIALLIISLLIGVAITYWFTRKNYNNLKNIVTIIKSVEQGKPLPVAPVKVIDEYGYILQNIIKAFIEQSFLKVQLSERSYRLRYMEMLALQSQINPHFLYNTLEIIYWKTVAISGRPNEASTMIEHLGDILKYALSSPQNKMVILQKELQHTQIYVEIQKIRYKDKFEVIWEVEGNLQRYFVPKLLLQPLIENSIYHGVREKPGKCCIKVSIRRLPSMISIHVIDNGVGMSSERLHEVISLMARDDFTNQGTTVESAKDISGNIGLYNTNKRLVLSYGELFKLRIVSKPGWGTSVQIRIPIDVSF
ncbi:histidine kinase [Paenibacillus sp. GP183]|uniref:sensor histidine kinase n=1 Tax=Paenibacillus sp. GP183 TaxID=1882751 RepID=UPI000B822AED|nr:histidine kinase [Paenibacillus sp. GP183]